MSTLNAQQAFISTYAGTGANGQSAFISFTFVNTSGFDAEIPVTVKTPASVSAGCEVYVHRSTDGGASWASEKTPGMFFARAASSTQTGTLLLPNGQFLVSVLVGGGSSATWSVQFAATARLITAYLGA